MSIQIASVIPQTRKISVTQMEEDAFEKILQVLQKDFELRRDSVVLQRLSVSTSETRQNIDYKVMVFNTTFNNISVISWQSLITHTVGLLHFQLLNKNFNHEKRYLRIDRNFCSVHEDIISIRLYTLCNPHSGLHSRPITVTCDPD
jgi:hypothetical protein